jgi:hypothetical protein
MAVANAANVKVERQPGFSLASFRDLRSAISLI